MNLFALLQEYIEFFPFVALGGLLLAGINLPISEDLIIITGALLSYKEPDLLVYNLLAIYIGVISTDFFVYWVGRRVRSGASKTGFFARHVPEKTLDKMHYFLDKYGIFTFIVGRFIPFGVRNTMFFSAGFFQLRFKFFVIYDIIAAMISINTLFFLTYNFGEEAKKPLKIAGIILFVAIVSGFISMIIRVFIKWRKRKAAKEASAELTDDNM